MRIENDIKLDYSDVLIKPKRSNLNSRNSVDILRHYKFLYSSNDFNGIPIIASNMDGVGTFSMAKEFQKHQMMTAIRKHYTKDQWKKSITELNNDYFILCVGSNHSDYEFLEFILNSYNIKFVCIDIANGYQESLIRFVEKVRKNLLNNHVLIVGNVVTSEMTEELLLRGADIIKIGIGPGSTCTTRIQTGVGYPQLSAVMECADAAHGLGGHIIADGGCTSPGDVSKAFAAGADFVMLGGMLAGHDECEESLKDGKYQFYGMSSDKAMERHGTKKSGYRAAEGKLVELEPRGPVKNTITEILGGIRSTCTYVGARRLKDLSKCTNFIRVNNTHNTVFNAISE